MGNFTVVDGPDLARSTLFIVARTCGILVVCVPTIIGNSLSIVVTRQVPELATSTKLLMTSLAVCDLLIGVLEIPHLVSSAVNFWPFGLEFCIAHAILSLYSVTMSIVFIIFLNVERYIAVSKPLRFAVLFQRWRVISAELFGSVSCFVIITLFVAICERPRVSNTATLFCNFDFNNGFLRVAMLCVWVVAPLIIITLIYCRLIRISRQHARRIRPGLPPRDRATLFGGFVRGTERKALRTFLAVTIAFAFCWTPYATSGAYAALSATPLPELLELAAFWLAASNSFLNVFIYCLFNRTFRRTAKRLITEKVNCTRRDPVVPRRARRVDNNESAF